MLSLLTPSLFSELPHLFIFLFELFFKKGLTNPLPLAIMLKYEIRRHGQVVRHGSAKPSSPVRIRVAPPNTKTLTHRVGVFCVSGWFPLEERDARRNLPSHLHKSHTPCYVAPCRDVVGHASGWRLQKLKRPFEVALIFIQSEGLACNHALWACM